MLTELTIKSAKPREKPYRLADGSGLYLEISPAGGKLWRWKYRFQGKEKRLSIGPYPQVNGRDARSAAMAARKALQLGIDPSAEKKARKAQAKLAADNSFKAVATLWYNKTSPVLVEKTRARLKHWLDTDLNPWIGSRPISEISAQDLLNVIRRIEDRGAADIARRVHNVCGRIFRYAVGHGLADRDPSRDIELRDILAPASTKHHASVKTPKEAGELMRAIDGYTGSLITHCALRLAPLVFVRPGELRHAEWPEIDFDKAEWRIPAPKMKMREQHIVPLSKQAIAILREIQHLTGTSHHIFPSERGGGRPMSENTINAALRRLGYSKDEMTGHGFRSMASTLLHELGYPHDVIERQLAHGERNKVAAAYNFAEYLPERRKMMQEWSDHLGKLRAGAAIIPLTEQAA